MHFPFVDWIDSHRQFDLHLSKSLKRALHGSKLQAFQPDCIYQLTGHIYSILLLAVRNETIFRDKLLSCL